MADQTQNSSAGSVQSSAQGSALGTESELKNQFSDFLMGRYPELKSHAGFRELISPQMISPYLVQLSTEILEKVQCFVSASFQLRTMESYKNFHQAEAQQRGLLDPGNYGICMSYDFHVDAENNPRLIEINTNAAFLAMGYEMYQWRQVPVPISGFQIDDFKSSLESEMHSAGKSKLQKIAIIDEEPEKQRLYVEFLIYQQLFKKWGYVTDVLDYRQPTYADLIYNRLTDFYFENESASELRRKFLNRDKVFSPNPYEYLLLADKQRLIEWSDEKFWQNLGSDEKTQSIKAVLKKYLPNSQSVTSENADEIWAQRKKLFFKPKRAFGSKQSYKGASISRKVFEDILAGDFIAQEYVAAPEKEFAANELSEKILGHREAQTFKYDLRFYAYRDQLQMVIARLYQGQVTNAKTLGGGFAPVQFIEG